MFLRPISSPVLAATFLAFSTALIACGGDGNTTSSTGTGGAGGATASSSSTSTGTTTGTGTGGAACAGRTITGTVTYSGTPAGANDVLRIAAVKDGMPGIPAGFNQYTMPTFPLQYEITSLPVDATAGYTNYGIIAYLDFGGDNFMGPGMDDPQYASMTLVKVTTTDCPTQDIPLPATP